MDTALPEEIIDWLLLQNKKAKDNLIIKSSEEVGPLYHIDKNKPVKFFPQMPRSAAASEDNTIARVTVAETLIGCLMGYARIERDFNYRKEYSKGKDPFKGGYVISEIDYHYCGMPSSAWRNFSSASSLYSAYQDDIKGNFDCRVNPVPRYN